MQRALQTGDAPPADAALRAVLVGCCAGGEARAAPRSSARCGATAAGCLTNGARVLVAAGEAAGARRAGAASSSTRSATRGGGVAPTRSGGGARGGGHEATRALAIAEWSSGRLTAAQARRALERLGQTGVAPRPVLASTLAYMLARDGAMGAAVPSCATADETAAAPGDAAAPRGRTPFVALLRAVRRREHVEAQRRSS